MSRFVNRANCFVAGALSLTVVVDLARGPDWFTGVSAVLAVCCLISGSHADD